LEVRSWKLEVGSCWEIQKINNKKYGKSLHSTVNHGTMEVNQNKQKTKEEVKK